MESGIWGRGPGYSSWRFQPTNVNRGVDTFRFPSSEQIRQFANEALGKVGEEDRLLEVESRYDDTLILKLRAPVKGADVVNHLAPRIEAGTVRNT